MSSLLYYLGVLWWARRLHVPAMVFAQGIGPLRRRLAKWATRRVLDRVALIAVRDQASADLLRELGVTRPPIHVTADASLLLDPPPPQAAGEAWRRGGIEPPTRPRIGVCVRPWQADASPAWTANLQRALADIGESRRASLVFVPMQQPGDAQLASTIAEGLGARPVAFAAPNSAQEAMALIGEMDVVVAMRLHALIFSCAMGVPCVGLAYDPKVREFMEAVGQPCLGLDAEPDAIADAIASALDQREQRAAQIVAVTERLRQAAARNVELAMGLLPSR